MDTVWKTAQAYIRCVRQVYRLSRLAGDAKTLERRLLELEVEILSQQLGNKHCAHCGSNELEALDGVQTVEGLEVGEFRCKACGLISH